MHVRRERRVGVRVKALFGVGAALVVCCTLPACGDDYPGGGRQNTLPGVAAPEEDAGADAEEPESEADPSEDGADF